MLFGKLLYALRALALGGLAITTVACGAADGLDDESTESTDEALQVNKLSPRFGAGGILFEERIGPTWPQVADPTNGASQRVFHRLKKAGVTRARQTAALSFNRGLFTVQMDVLAAKREGIDLFIMVHLGHCQNPVAAQDIGNPSKDHGCSDVMAGTVDQGAAAFKNRFRAIYLLANPNGEQNVRTWSVNEPDLDMDDLTDGPERAAAFYTVARQVLNEEGCPDCRLVAGELARYKEEWFDRYVKELVKRGRKPSRFSIHPYGDVNRVTPANWKTVHPDTTAAYVKAVHHAFPEAKIWLTEVGRMLHRDEPGDDFCVSSACGWASGRFVRERLAKWPGVTRVYWWDMASSQKDGWDSALADHNGKYRAMLYGLLGYSKKTALDKAAGSDPGPWR